MLSPYAWEDQRELQGNILPSAEGSIYIASPEGNIQILPGKVVSSNPLNNSLIQSFHSFDPNAVWTAFV